MWHVVLIKSKLEVCPVVAAHLWRPHHHDVVVNTQRDPQATLSKHELSSTQRGNLGEKLTHVPSSHYS